MSRTAAEILEEARQLPATERDWIVQELLGEGDVPGEEEIDESWKTEVERRIAEIDSGAVKMIPGEEVLARMDLRLRTRIRQAARQE